MKTLPIWQVDVCAAQLFAGNPAAVCPLQEWLPDAVMQAIAAENNVAETAFFVKDESGVADYLLRWFTPTVEIELCGHATLASGYVLLEQLGVKQDVIRFNTVQAGVLTVERRDGALWLNLPARMPAHESRAPAALAEGLGATPAQVLGFGNKFMALYERAEQVRDLQPDFAALRKINRGIVVTAPGTPGEDFVSRFFFPSGGIDEDPVTGSAHCLLIPYWAQRLGKTVLDAAQLSARGGRLKCRLDGERVWISGPVVPYLKGEIYVQRSLPGAVL